MKTIFILPFLLPFIHLSAQEYGVILKKENNSYKTLHINNVNPHAVRDMASSYENAEDVEWTIDEAGTTTADFTEENKRVKLNYDKFGNLLTSRKTYNGEFLDPIIASFAKKLAGKSFIVNLVTEVIKKNKTIYEISLQNRTHLCIVTFSGDNINGFESSGDVRLYKREN